jgi:hypothetical protein
MELDGVRLPTGQTHVPLADDGLTHELRVTLGPAVKEAAGHIPS